MGSVNYNLIIKIDGHDTAYHYYNPGGELSSLAGANETLYIEMWNNRKKLTAEVRNVGILGSPERYDVIFIRHDVNDNNGEVLQINKKTGRVRKGTWRAGPIYPI